MKEIMDAIARINAEIEAIVMADGKVAEEQLQARRERLEALHLELKLLKSRATSASRPG